jgi:hypothetical protein
MHPFSQLLIHRVALPSHLGAPGSLNSKPDDPRFPSFYLVNVFLMYSYFQGAHLYSANSFGAGRQRLEVYVLADGVSSFHHNGEILGWDAPGGRVDHYCTSESPS